MSLSEALLSEWMNLNPFVSIQLFSFYKNEYTILN